MLAFFHSCAKYAKWVLSQNTIFMKNEEDKETDNCTESH